MRVIRVAAMIVLLSGPAWICGALVGNVAEGLFVGVLGLRLALDLSRRLLFVSFPCHGVSCAIMMRPKPPARPPPRSHGP
jgi:hypothetical protein